MGLTDRGCNPLLETWEKTRNRTRKETSYNATIANREKRKRGRANKPPRPAPEDLLPSARLHLLKVSQTAPPAGDQALERLSLRKLLPQSIRSRPPSVRRVSVEGSAPPLPMHACVRGEHPP